MEITIKDYNGYNPGCATVKDILGYIEKNKCLSMDELFEYANFDYNDVLRFIYYIIPERRTEFERWALNKFAFENMFKEHIIELNKLSNERNIAMSEITKIQGLNPARVYSYFRMRNRYATDGAYYGILNNVLNAIIANSTFEKGDYIELHKCLSRKWQYHYNSEYHYRVAIEYNNNSAWKEIELFLNRKPYIIDGKRCYEGFEFQISRNEYYKCTGWNEKGNIKFIISESRNHDKNRKLLNFTYGEFKEYFKGKKFFKF